MCLADKAIEKTLRVCIITNPITTSRQPSHRTLRTTAPTETRVWETGASRLAQQTVRPADSVIHWRLTKRHGLSYDPHP